MAMKNFNYIFLSLVLFAVGCGPKKAEKFIPLHFPKVNVPSIYAGDMEASIEYAALHFWDAFTDTLRHYPSDSALVSGVAKEAVEEEYANYVGLLGMLTYNQASRSVDVMFRRSADCEKADTSSNVFETLTEFTEKYLYDPNSPLRNEDIYQVFAKRMAEYEGISPEKRAKYAREAGMCSLNMVGTKAADFPFSDRTGKVMSLYGIRAGYTLLFFSNPGCEACMEIIKMLTSDDTVNGMIASGSLAVVNVYIDEDVAAWYDYMSVYPKDWYNGYDHNLIIRTDSLYNVRAIPSVYLLDKDKTVIMKDAVPENVIGFLGNLNE